MTNLEFLRYMDDAELPSTLDFFFRTAEEHDQYYIGLARTKEIMANIRKHFQDKAFLGTPETINLIVSTCLQDSYWLVFDSNIAPALQQHYFKGLTCQNLQ